MDDDADAAPAPPKRKIEPDIIDEGEITDRLPQPESIDAERLQQIMDDDHESLLVEENDLWKTSAFTCHDLVFQYRSSSPPLCVDFVPDPDDRWGMPMVFGTQKNADGNGCLYLIDLDFELTADLFNDDIRENRAPQWNEFSDDVEGVGFRPLQENQPCVKLLQKFEEKGDINRCKVSPDGKFCATLSEEGVVTLYDLDQQKRVWSTKGHEEEGFALEWCGDKSFITGANDGAVRLWNVQDPEKRQEILQRKQAINDISVTSDGLVVIVGDDGCVLCNPKTSTVEEINCPAANCVDWDKESQELVVGCLDHVIRIYSTSSLKTPLREYKLATSISKDELRQVRFCPFRRGMFSTCCGEKVQIWDEEMAPGRERHELAKRDEMKLKVLLAEENDFPTEVLFTYGGHIDNVMDIAWSDTDWYVKASVGLDGLHIWQMSTSFYSDELGIESDADELIEEAAASSNSPPKPDPVEKESAVPKCDKDLNKAPDEEPLTKRAKLGI